MDDALFPRFAGELVSMALENTPVVMVTGPPQCGKTTMVRDLLGANREFVTLDNDTVLAAVRADPTGLVRQLDRATIDEVQRVPDLLRAIKRSVDDDRRPGRFLLTGSANILTLPQVSESLAGRMEIVNLLPLSRAEMRGKKPRFLKDAFEGKVARPLETTIGEDLVEAVLVGGYPEMLRRNGPKRRRAWARDYVKAIVQGDMRKLADVEKLDKMPRLLQVLAHHSGQLTNFTEVGDHIGMDDKTTRKYVGILEQIFLVRRVEPWFRHRLKRLVKTPKVHFLDSGLLSRLLGANAERIASDRCSFGALLKTLVFPELLKEASWFDESCALYHYRDKDQDEVDFVMERGSGAVVGIEVKASATVNAADFKGLRKLSGACRDYFKLGLLLYDGDKAVPFGEGLYAAPISCLWAPGKSP